MKKLEYAGFWIRFVASIIDTLVVLAVMIPVMLSIYGMNYVSVEKTSDTGSSWSSAYSFSGGDNWLINYALPAVIVLAFWFYKSATPGKMLTRLTIVDAKSGEKPTPMQFVIRYLGYFLSSLLFCLGFLWIAFDKKKQGFHDKIAGTVVVRDIQKEDVVFGEQ